ncbi:MAG TPA: hypothetical protein ENJ95_13180 [Bacteroidetes bacterium]|nr:hypothetical protein [Bacteroidota bacterium]
MQKYILQYICLACHFLQAQTSTFGIESGVNFSGAKEAWSKYSRPYADINSGLKKQSYNHIGIKILVEYNNKQSTINNYFSQ